MPTLEELYAPDWKPLDVPCPECHEMFFLAQYPGVNLYGCGSCGSAWLDNDGCRRLLTALLPEAVMGTVRSMDRMPSTEVKQAGYREAARGHGGPRLCPWCRVELTSNLFSGVEVDACTTHGTFFDKREIVRLSGVMSLNDDFLRGFHSVSSRPPRSR